MESSLSRLNGRFEKKEEKKSEEKEEKKLPWSSSG